MQSVTLYVDKWYIIGAVCTDGVPRLIRLPNREDRFWLYFYEDTANNSIVYGRGNQSHYRDKENHYYGDIFSAIVDPSKTFTIYGRQRSMNDIFKVSDIFDCIKSEIGMEKEIATFISFSSDISDAARKIFLDILEENGFVIKESVARIDHLALEYGYRHSLFKESGYYLVLNACNENLHYSIYKHEGDYFNRVTEGVLLGMGIDLRRRALIEAVVEYLNKRLHFLSSFDEKETEYLRMRQFVDDWMIKLSNAKPNIPITIPNVFFSGKSANAYSVPIIRKKIDDRTSVIVNDIIRGIIDFVKQSNVRTEEIKGVLFLGNTFTNTQFEQGISEQFWMAKDSLVIYKESELPNIVGVYSVINCDQFSAATTIFLQNAEDEKIRLKNAREEEERKKKVAEEQERIAKAESDALKAEKQYRDLMDAAEVCRRNQDYVGMQDNCKDALAVRPDDPEAQQKLQDALRLAAEEAATAKQYNSIIQRAKRSLDEAQWSEAKAQAENALTIRPSSEEAQRIYNEATKCINIDLRIKEYLTRADLFIAQKAYEEAISELKRALGLDEDNTEVVERLRDIESRQKQCAIKVQELMSKLQSAEQSNQLADAVTICEQLIDLDVSNTRKWNEKMLQIREQINDAAKRTQKLNLLRKNINSALFVDDWDTVISLCKESLEVEYSEEINSILEKANTQLNKERIRKENEAKQRDFENKISEIKALIADKKIDSASQKLRVLQSEYPDSTEIYKELRKRMFDAEGIFPQGHSPKSNENKDRTNAPSSTSTVEDDFFGTTTSKNNKQATEPQAKTGNDFFDSDFVRKGSSSRTQNANKEINHDFDF